jgi:hypothetical protein
MRMSDGVSAKTTRSNAVHLAEADPVKHAFDRIATKIREQEELLAQAADAVASIRDENERLRSALDEAYGAMLAQLMAPDSDQLGDAVGRLAKVLVGLPIKSLPVAVTNDNQGRREILPLLNGTS